VLQPKPEPKFKPTLIPADQTAPIVKPVAVSSPTVQPVVPEEVVEE